MPQPTHIASRSISTYLSTIFQQSTRGSCPACGHDSFSLAPSKVFAKCFHPTCGFVASANYDGVGNGINGTNNTSNTSNIYTSFTSMLENFFAECHAHLLSSPNNPAFIYCKERGIAEKVIHDADLGSVPSAQVIEKYSKQISDMQALLTQRTTETILSATASQSFSNDEYLLALTAQQSGRTLTAKQKKILEAVGSDTDNQQIFLQSAFDKFVKVFANPKNANHLMFAYRDNNYKIRSIKIRQPSTANKFFALFKPYATKSGMFGSSLFSPSSPSSSLASGKQATQTAQAKPTLFVEGEFNALTLQSLTQNVANSYSACLAYGGAQSVIPSEISSFSLSAKPIIMPDNDTAGEATVQLVQQHITFQRIRLPDGVSDLDEYVCSTLQGKTTQETLQAVRTLLSKRELVHFEPANIGFARKIDEKGRITINYPRLARFFIDRYQPFSVGDDVFLYGAKGTPQGVYGEANNFLIADIQRILGEDYTVHGLNETLSFIRNHNPVNSDLINASGVRYVNLRNGMFDLQEKRLLPHDPSYLSTIRIPVSYDPLATCPAILAFLHSSLDHSVIDLILEIVGYLLIPDSSFEKGFYFTGRAGSGKSTLLSLITAFLGTRNICNATAQDLAGGDKFIPSVMLGKLCNICDDLASTSLRQAENLKSIVSGKRITAQRKYGAPFEFSPFARLIFACNELPGTSDRSEGFWRRWIIVPFEKSFTATGAENINLLETLITPNELSGLLNVALDALFHLQEKKRFSQPEIVNQALLRYKKDADSIFYFVDEFFELDCGKNCDLGYKILRSELWDKYESFCKDSKVFESSRVKFFSRIRGMGCKDYKDRIGNRFFLGIREKDSDFEEIE